MNLIIKRKYNIHTLFFLAYFIFCSIQVFATSRPTESQIRRSCFSNQRGINGSLELYAMETDKDCSFVAQMNYEDLMNFLTKTEYIYTFMNKKEKKPILSKEPVPATDFCELGVKIIDGSLQIYCPYHGSENGLIAPDNTYRPSKYFQQKIDKKKLAYGIAIFFKIMVS